MLASTPEAPYYAVIFSAIQSNQLEGYEETVQKIVELAKKQDGFLGVESAQEGFEITVSYWKDEESIRKWYQNMEHRAAQEMGKKKWYDGYYVRVAKVERAYSFEK